MVEQLEIEGEVTKLTNTSTCVPATWPLAHYTVVQLTIIITSTAGLQESLHSMRFAAPSSVASSSVRRSVNTAAYSDHSLCCSRRRIPQKGVTFGVPLDSDSSEDESDSASDSDSDSDSFCYASESEVPPPTS